MSDKKKKTTLPAEEEDSVGTHKRPKSATHSREGSKDDKMESYSEPIKRKAKEKKHKKSSSKVGESDESPPTRVQNMHSGNEETDPSPQIDPDPPAKKAMKGTPSPKSSAAMLEARGENESSDDDVEEFFTPTATPPLLSGHSRVMTADEEEELIRMRRERQQDGRRRGAFYAHEKEQKKVGLDPMAPVEEAPNSSSGLASDTLSWSGAKQANKFHSKSKRLQCGFAETVGRRPTMEDDFVFVGQFRGDPYMDLVGLFDGHRGTSAAKFAARELSTVLTQSLKTAKPKEALKQAFLDMHAQMKADDIKSGATALAALFTKNKVFIANAGDSRAVLCRGDKAIRLTTDHRPDIPQEIERISKLGGNITNDVTKDGKVVARVEGLLGVSRALGDFDLEPYVTAEPEIAEFVIHSDDDESSGKENQFVIMACDGLWEMLSDQEAVDLASFFVTNRTAEGAAKRLRDVAYARGSTDNISVSVIKLPSREDDRVISETTSTQSKESNGSSGSTSSKRGTCIIV